MSTKFTVNIQIPQAPEQRTPQDTEQEMLNQAIAFFQAGSRCEADFRLTPNVTNHLAAPAIVCYAFAIERDIKLLNHMVQASVKKKHNLIDLFNTLPKDYIQVIVKYYGLSEVELREAIQTVSNAFVEWRYLYEQNGAIMSITVLANICICLHKAIREFKPSLLVTFENRH